MTHRAGILALYVMAREWHPRRRADETHPGVSVGARWPDDTRPHHAGGCLLPECPRNRATGADHRPGAHRGRGARARSTTHRGARSALTHTPSTARTRGECSGSGRRGMLRGRVPSPGCSTPTPLREVDPPSPSGCFDLIVRRRDLCRGSGDGGMPRSDMPSPGLSSGAAGFSGGSHPIHRRWRRVLEGRGMRSRQVWKTAAVRHRENTPREWLYVI